MHGIYNYIPETNHASTVHSVTAVLYLQSVLHVMLFRPWNMFCAFTLALPAVCVQCTIWLFFCSTLISCFLGMLLRYSLSDSELVPVAPVITGITLLSHSTCAEFLLWILYILKSSRLLSWSHLCLIIIIIIIIIIHCAASRKVAGSIPCGVTEILLT